MPRDDLRSLGEVRLPAGRSGRVVETVAAGQFVVEVVGCDWIARLAGAGALSRDQVEAAQVLAVLFEAAGLRQHLGARYDSMVIDAATDVDSPFERMTAAETRAWHRLHRLLVAAPLHCRGEVEAVACWDHRPISIPRLRAGLGAVAAAISRPRRR